jgi:PEGA domain
MRHARGLILLIVLAAAAVAAAGDIQVLCEPGLRVYLDGELAGISSRLDDGAYLMEVSRGLHTVRVEKDGFVPQSFEVLVGQVPVEVSVSTFEPAPPAAGTQETAGAGNALAVGTLIVTSAPQNCVVEVSGTPHTKTSPQLVIGGIAAGEHTLRFTKPGYDPVTKVVEVQPSATVAVHGNLKKAEVVAVQEGWGSLRVTSEPSRCTVRFLGKTSEKTTLNLNLSRIPAGEHPITVSIPGRELTTKVLILDEQITVVKVSFVKGDEPFVISHVPD